MRISDTPSQISASRLRALIATYSAHVPEKLQALDTFRLTTLPQTIRTRKSAAKPSASGSQTAHITLPELQQLVTWKLSRGKFRPTLTKLVASNAPNDVVAITGRAFKAYDAEIAGSGSGSGAKDVEHRGKARERALAVLTQLRGVGPATASLVLAMYDPTDVPFFSDELFAWLATSAGSGSGSAARDVNVWQGKMAYNVKEYKLLCERLDALRERLEEEDFNVVDVEHAAWMIVKGLGTEGDEVPVEDKNVEEPHASDAKNTEDTSSTTATTKKRSAPPNKQAIESGKRNKRKYLCEDR